MSITVATAWPTKDGITIGDAAYELAFPRDIVGSDDQDDSTDPVNGYDHAQIHDNIDTFIQWTQDFFGSAGVNIATITTAVMLAGTQTITGAKTFALGALLDKGNHFFDVHAYGAVGDAVTDDSVAIQAAITAASSKPGGVVLFRTGYDYVALGLTAAANRVWFYSPGGANIRTSSATGVIVSVAADYCGFENITFGTTAAPATAGGAVLLTSGTHARFINCSFSAFYDSIKSIDGYLYNIESCYFVNHVHAAVARIATSSPDSGDSEIYGCEFDSSAASYHVYYDAGGGDKIFGNKFIHADTAILGNVRDGVSTTGLYVTANSFEAQTSYGVRMKRAGTTGLWLLPEIFGNEFAQQGGTGVAIDDAGFQYAIISSNTMRMNGASPGRAVALNVAAVSPSIIGNAFIQAAVGIYVSTTGGTVLIGSNTYSGCTLDVTAGYSYQKTPDLLYGYIGLRDPAGVIAHGVTTLMPTNQYAQISPVDNSFGGALLTGVINADQAGFKFTGVNAGPTVAPLVFNSALKSGTGVATKGSDPIADFHNNGTTVVRVLGSGTLNLTGLTASRLVGTDGSKNLISVDGAATYQPLDSDLTAIAALTTTSYGRAFLALADAAAAKTAIGAVIGTNVQAWDADLDAIAALTSAANKVPYSTGAQAWALADFTAAGRSLVAGAAASNQRTTLGSTTVGDAVFIAADAAAARTALALGTIATQAANAVAITGGTIASLTSLAAGGALQSGTLQTNTIGSADALTYGLLLINSATRTTNLLQRIGIALSPMALGGSYTAAPRIEGVLEEISNNAMGLHFYAYDGANPIEVMAVTTDRASLGGKRVGIGVATPLAALDVRGTVRTDQNVASAAVLVTFPAAQGPTGSTAGGPQGWWKVNMAGTDRYIPFW